MYYDIIQYTIVYYNNCVLFPLYSPLCGFSICRLVMVLSMLGNLHMN